MHDNSFEIDPQVLNKKHHVQTL